MWSPSTGWGDAKYVLESHNLTPIALSAKEGLALINGTQLITSIGAEAAERAALIAKQADIVAALTLEVLKGTSRAFDSDVHALRAHKGQNVVARKLRALLHSETFPSEIAQSHRFCNRVQVKLEDESMSHYEPYESYESSSRLFLISIKMMEDYM